MKNISKLVYILFSILFLSYLAIPNQVFPDSEENSLRSLEPADVETDLRKGYYTDSERQDTIGFYRGKFDMVKVFGYELKLPSVRLNYPPEESQYLIRDQTRSTYLEEIVHPFRESLFVNGFEPKMDKDRIIVEEKEYRQKIIIKLYESDYFTRLLIGLITLVILYYQIKLWNGLIFCNNQYDAKKS